MDILSPKFDSISQNFSNVDQISKAVNFKDQVEYNEKPIALFRKQAGDAWVVIQREPSGIINGFIQKLNQEPTFFPVKGIANYLKVDHLEEATQIINASHVILKPYCIDVIIGLKGGGNWKVRTKNAEEAKKQGEEKIEKSITDYKKAINLGIKDGITRKETADFERMLENFRAFSESYAAYNKSTPVDIAIYHQAKADLATGKIFELKVKPKPKIKDKSIKTKDATESEESEQETVKPKNKPKSTKTKDAVESEESDKEKVVKPKNKAKLKSAKKKESSED